MYLPSKDGRFQTNILKPRERDKENKSRSNWSEEGRNAKRGVQSRKRIKKRKTIGL